MKERVSEGTNGGTNDENYTKFIIFYFLKGHSRRSSLL